MSADIIMFVPRSNPKSDRAFWIGPDPIAIMAQEIMKDDAFRGEDTAPSEWCADSGDCA